MRRFFLISDVGRCGWWGGVGVEGKKKRTSITHVTVTRPPRVIGEVETCREYLTADVFPPERRDALQRRHLGVFSLLPQGPLSPGWRGAGWGGDGGGGGKAGERTGGFPMNLLTWFPLLPTGSHEASEKSRRIPRGF